ncbi:MAG: peptidoglycan editing factor PgeF [Butyrivibrio sp.]
MNINYLNFEGTTVFHQGLVPYFSFRNLDRIPWIRNAFSTRLGGVSEGIYGSMNLNFTRGDDEEKVRRNYELFGKATGLRPENMVMAKQTHTTNVLRVNESHMGMGIVRERNFDDIDGLITDCPGVVLVTAYADCVPLYFVDTVHKAIGLSHSGWRGTVNNMAGVTVNKMQKEFGTNPADIVAFVGPSICVNCYEVGADVADEFAKAYKSEVFDGILSIKDEKNMKFRLNLHEANRKNLLNAGLNPDNIMVTDVCTCCNPEILYSHRASRGLRGGLCGFLQIIDTQL